MVKKNGLERRASNIDKLEISHKREGRNVVFTFPDDSYANLFMIATMTSKVIRLLIETNKKDIKRINSLFTKQDLPIKEINNIINKEIEKLKGDSNVKK